MLYQTFILIFLFLCSKLSITSILNFFQLMAERLLLTQLSSIAWVFGLFFCSLSFQLQQESLFILSSSLYWNKLILIYLEVCNILRLVLLTDLKMHFIITVAMNSPQGVRHSTFLSVSLFPIVTHFCTSWWSFCKLLRAFRFRTYFL